MVMEFSTVCCGAGARFGASAFHVLLSQAWTFRTIFSAVELRGGSESSAFVRAQRDARSGTRVLNGSCVIVLFFT